MIVIITGPSHSGKTKAAQDLSAKYGFSCLSLDLLKMGLIRSGYTDSSPLSDESVLTDLLWPITKEMIKTAIENNQNLIVEGIYIPFDWYEQFEGKYLDKIEYRCIIFSSAYIQKNFTDILKYENIIEDRSGLNNYTLEQSLEDHKYYREMTALHNLNTIVIDDIYAVEITLSL